MQFLVDLPGLVRQALSGLVNVFLGIALFAVFWTCVIALCLAVLYELFLAPPATPRALTTSDLWWVVAFCFYGGFIRPMLAGRGGRNNGAY